MTNRRELDRQITDWSRRAKKVAQDFKGAQRRRVLRAGAQPVIKSARSLAPRSARPHFRYRKDGSKVTINPGNLRRSIKVMPRRKVKRSQDVFIGPLFGKPGSLAREVGGAGQPVDAYYARMVFGGARQFRNRVLRPALSSAGNIALQRMRIAARKQLRDNARKNRVA